MTKDNDNAKSVTIFVNGEDKLVEEEEISYEQLVLLAFADPPKETGVTFIITVDKDPETGKSGTVGKGDRIKVAEGMAFKVRLPDGS